MLALVLMFNRYDDGTHGRTRGIHALQHETIPLLRMSRGGATSKFALKKLLSSFGGYVPTVIGVASRQATLDLDTG